MRTAFRPMYFWVAVFCSRRYPCPSRDPHRPFVRRDPKVPCTVALSPSEPRDIPFVSLGELPSPPLSWVPGLPPGARSCGTYVGSGYVGPYPDLTCVRKGWILAPGVTTNPNRRHPLGWSGFACPMLPSPPAYDPRGSIPMGRSEEAPFGTMGLFCPPPERKAGRGSSGAFFGKRLWENRCGSPQPMGTPGSFPGSVGSLSRRTGYSNGDFTLGLAPPRNSHSGSALSLRPSFLWDLPRHRDCAGLPLGWGRKLTPGLTPFVCPWGSTNHPVGPIVPNEASEDVSYRPGRQASL